MDFAIGKIRRQKQSSIFWGLDLQYIIRMALIGAGDQLVLYM